MIGTREPGTVYRPAPRSETSIKVGLEIRPVENAGMPPA